MASNTAKQDHEKSTYEVVHVEGPKFLGDEPSAIPGVEAVDGYVADLTWTDSEEKAVLRKFDVSYVGWKVSFN